MMAGAGLIGISIWMEMDDRVPRGSYSNSCDRPRLRRSGSSTNPVAPIGCFAWFFLKHRSALGGGTEMAPESLFAYGTLAPDGPEAASRGGWEPDMVRGRLYDLGPYPALVDVDDPEAGWVAGHVRAVDPAELGPARRLRRRGRGPLPPGPRDDPGRTARLGLRLRPPSRLTPEGRSTAGTGRAVSYRTDDD